MCSRVLFSSTFRHFSSLFLVDFRANPEERITTIGYLSRNHSSTLSDRHVLWDYLVDFCFYTSFGLSHIFKNFMEFSSSPPLFIQLFQTCWSKSKTYRLSMPPFTGPANIAANFLSARLHPCSDLASSVLFSER